MRERYTADRAFPLLVRVEEVLQDLIQLLGGDPDQDITALVDRADKLLVEIGFALSPNANANLSPDRKDSPNA